MWGFLIPTEVKVESLDAQGNVIKSLTVRVNDHGPFESGSQGKIDRLGYVIDLSKSAYNALGGNWASPRDPGFIRVRVTVR